MDIPSIICYTVIKVAFANRTMGSMPFSILIMKILIKENVPFKAGNVLHWHTSSVIMGSLSKMGFITKEGENSNTFKPNHTQSASTSVHGTMMYLLNTLVSKVTKIIKNQHRLTKNQHHLSTNQKAIIAHLSYVTPDEPLLLVLANESEESEGRERLRMRRPMTEFLMATRLMMKLVMRSRI